mgnify:CR=1 FL=1
MFSVAFLVSYSIYKLKMIAPRPLKTEFNNVDWKNKLNNPTTIIDINPIKRNFPKKLTSLIKIDKIDNNEKNIERRYILSFLKVDI